MVPEAHLACLDDDALALSKVLGGLLTVPVPSTPGWTIGDLGYHVGGIHRFWEYVVRTGATTNEGAPVFERPADDDLSAWFLEGAAELRRTLADAPLERKVWSWSQHDDVAFVIRRMAQETAMHRWDGENAVGDARAIEPAELAIDGVDEFFDTQIAEDFLGPGGESIALVASDAPARWLATVADGSVTCVRAEGRADATVRAPASDLLLMLWRRIGPFDLDVTGDRVALARFLGRADLD
jgi:uncharacterized protein (TIGR03083 family)